MVELRYKAGPVAVVGQQRRELRGAIRESRERNASVAQVLPCYHALQRIEQQLAAA